MNLLAYTQAAGQIEKRLDEKYGVSDAYRMVTELTEEVGEVAEAVKAEEGVAGKEDAKGKIGSELADVLFSVFVLADKYHVNLDEEFTNVCKGIERRYL